MSVVQNVVDAVVAKAKSLFVGATADYAKFEAEVKKIFADAEKGAYPDAEAVVAEAEKVAGEAVAKVEAVATEVKAEVESLIKEL